MPIKNKDGSTLTLRGPNPLMNDQELWDPKNLTLHNFKWKSVVLPSDGRRVQPVERREPTIAEELFEPEPEIHVQEVEPEPEPVPVVVEPKPEPVPVPKPRVEVQPVRKPTGKLRVHCLPASVSEYKDDLYDQSYRTVQYGEKFITDAGVMSQGDIEAVFWTTDERVTPGSILYPMTMEKRWWKVVGTQERPLGGIFVHCHISDQQFRFD